MPKPSKAKPATATTTATESKRDKAEAAALLAALRDAGFQYDPGSDKTKPHIVVRTMEQMHDHLIAGMWFSAETVVQIINGEHAFVRCLLFTLCSSLPFVILLFLRAKRRFHNILKR